MLDLRLPVLRDGVAVTHVRIHRWRAKSGPEGINMLRLTGKHDGMSMKLRLIDGIIQSLPSRQHFFRVTLHLVMTSRLADSKIVLIITF